MRKIASSEQIAEVDRISIEKYGISGELLMGFAGRAIFDRLQDYLPFQPIILLGKGNNAGDGLVLSHFLINAGIQPELLLLWPEDDFSPTSMYYWRILKKEEDLFRYSFMDSEESFKEKIKQIYATAKDPLLLVDAVFGTGLNAPLRSKVADIARIWNELSYPGLRRIAIDIPSGVNGSGLDLKSEILRADITFTMGLSKWGLHLHPGKSKSGIVMTLDIGFPRSLLKQSKLEGHLLDKEDFYTGSPWLPALPPIESHKYHRGIAHIFAGKEGTEGAALLSSLAAHIGGAGLVKLYTRSSLASQLRGHYPFIQVHDLADEPYPDAASQESLRESYVDYILASLSEDKRAQSLLLGPGLGRDEFGQRIVGSVVRFLRNGKIKFPTIWDADACFLLPRTLSVQEYKQVFSQGEGHIATPHLGELVEMFTSREPGKNSQENFTEELKNNFSQDKISTLKDLVQKHGIHLIAKGNDSVAMNPSGNFFINTSGNPLLARGGSGDILGGLLAAFTCNGMPLLEAMASANYLLGWSADELLQQNGPYSSGADRILESLKNILSGLSHSHDMI